MIQKVYLFLAEVFSKQTFMFGWPFFWRWFIVVNIPFIITKTLSTMIRLAPHPNGPTITHQVPWMIFIPYAVLVLGFLMKKLRRIHHIEESDINNNALSLGLRTFFYLAMAQLVLFLPMYCLNFIIGLFTGLVLAFQSRETEILGASSALTWAVAMAIQPFLLGFIGQRVLKLKALPAAASIPSVFPVKKVAP